MKKILNANSLKLIAVIAMTLDHIAWMLFPIYSKNFLPLLFHIIGRITAPIMCYFVAQGYYYTKNINKYTARLFLFAFISHVPYVLASISFTDATSFIPFYNGNILNQTSIMWSLAFGLVLLRISESQKLHNGFVKILLTILICLITLPSDWSCIASLWILAFGSNRNNFKAQMLWMIFYAVIYSTVYFFALDKLYGLIQMFVILAIPLLMMYNGKLSERKSLNVFTKWAFYIYYPLHLLVLAVIGAFL